MRHGRCAKAAEAEGAVPVAAVVEGLGAVVVAAAVAAVVAADMEEPGTRSLAPACPRIAPQSMRMIVPL